MKVLGVMQGAETLWPHNEGLAGFDRDLDAAVLRALHNVGSPVFDAFDDSPDAMVEHLPKVRLLFVKPDPAPVPFLDVLEAEWLPNMYGPCDRCLALAVPAARLWLEQGSSIVQVECCLQCKTLLDAEHDNLVWR